MFPQAWTVAWQELRCGWLIKSVAPSRHIPGSLYITQVSVLGRRPNSYQYFFPVTLTRICVKYKYATKGGTLCKSCERVLMCPL